MATARKAARKRTSERASKRRSPARSARRARPTGERSVNEILMDLGRQALVDGVKEVLEDHGVDSSVKVEMVLKSPRRKGARKAKRTTRRR